jgi:hypothetical protein
MSNGKTIHGTMHEQFTFYEFGSAPIFFGTGCHIFVLSHWSWRTGTDVGFLSEEQLSNINCLSGSNLLTNRILNKKIIIYYIAYLIKNLLK